KEVEIADHQVQIAKNTLKRSKRWWLENISLSFNANEFTIKRFQKSSEPDDIGFLYTNYPLYNIGINIPIGVVFTKSMEVKSARESVAISKAQREQKHNALKANVLSAYADYVQYKKLYTLQLKSTESVFNEFLQAKQKFKMDEISLKEYNAASSRYDDALKNKVGAEHDYQLAKISLEELIGIPVENLLSD